MAAFGRRPFLRTCTDFGPPSYGLPFDVVGRRHAKTHVRFTYADESDRGPYPFDARTPMEGGSDRHALIVERGTCRLYELFAASWNDGEPHAGSGAVFDLIRTDSARRAWTSADAAGLPILPGLVRWDEVKAGSIDHAIRFTVSCTTDAYVWPARHEAGVHDPDCPPMGARFRLKANFDLDGFSARARTVLRAMQTYGLMLADNGSNWYFRARATATGAITCSMQLKTVPASAFGGGRRERLHGGRRRSGQAPDCPRLSQPSVRDRTGSRSPTSGRSRGRMNSTGDEQPQPAVRRDHPVVERHDSPACSGP